MVLVLSIKTVNLEALATKNFKNEMGKALKSQIKLWHKNLKNHPSYLVMSQIGY